MGYIVWSKEQYAETWTRTDCADEAAVRAEVLRLLKQAGEVVVTLPIEYEVTVQLGGRMVEPPEERPVEPVPAAEPAETEVKSEATEG